MPLSFSAQAAARGAQKASHETFADYVLTWEEMMELLQEWFGTNYDFQLRKKGDKWAFNAPGPLNDEQKRKLDRKRAEKEDAMGSEPISERSPEPEQ